jgi:NAD(P)-dependent dehydrogenase (short-subunit alcohol dehydrogenase family)
MPSSSRFEGQVVLITGGASGIGHATASRFLAEGASVGLIDINPEVDNIARSLEPERAMGAVADAADPDAVGQAISAAGARLGPANVLVNGAGIAGRSAAAWDVSDEEWDDMMRITLRSVFVCTRAVIDTMRQRGAGRIINIASVAGKEGNPNASPYSAAKAAVIAFTKAVAKEVAREGIYVNAVAPGLIETPMNRQVSEEHLSYMLERIPIGRIGQPEEVAAMIAFLASEDLTFTTGQVFDVSGGRATY